MYDETMKKQARLVLVPLVLAMLACGIALYGAPSEPSVAVATVTSAPLEPAAPESPVEPDSAPLPTMTAVVIFPTMTALPITGGGGGDEPAALPEPQPALPESRRLNLDWPARMRAGDSDRIRLTLEIDDQGDLVATASAEGHQVTFQTIDIPNLYDTHNIVAEARLDLAGVVVRPSGSVSEPLLPGQPVIYYWSVQPDQAGTYRGAVWLYLQFVPLDGGQVSRRTVSIQEIEIEATTFLGLGGQTARVTGTIGGVLSTILGIPFMEDVLRWVWRRRKR